MEMEAEDPASFKNFEPAMFHEPLQRLVPTIAKKDMWYCKSLHPELRLAIILRFLDTSDSYYSLIYGFRVAHNMISLIVRDVCQAIIDIYEDEVVSLLLQRWVGVGLLIVLVSDGSSSMPLGLWIANT